MKTIKEPKEVDFSVKSEPWTELELIEFRKIIKESKIINNKKKSLKIKLKSKIIK